MEAGDVLYSEEKGYRVVLSTTNGEAVEVEKLEDFISKVVVVNHGGKSINIKELVEKYCYEYLCSNTIITD